MGAKMPKLKTLLGFAFVTASVSLFPAMTAQAGAADLTTQSDGGAIRLAGLGLILLTLHAMDRYLWPRIATRNVG